MWSGGLPAPVDPATRYKIAQVEGEVTAAENTVRGDERGVKEAELNWRQAGYSLLNERLTLAPEFQINDNNLGLGRWSKDFWGWQIGWDEIQAGVEAVSQNVENGRRSFFNGILSLLEFMSADARIGGDYGVARLRFTKFDPVNYLRVVAGRAPEWLTMIERAMAELANLNTKADGINQRQGLSNSQNGEVVATRGEQLRADKEKLNEAEEKLAEANRDV